MARDGSDGAAHVTLVGRDEELAAARSALVDGGCVIAGPAGIGRTRLAADVAIGRPPTSALLHAVGTATAMTLPFGAVRHLVPDVFQTEGLAAIPELIGALRDLHPDAPPTLLVDDAHLLDPGSAALLLALATTGAALLVLTVRSNEVAPDALVALWKDGHLERVDLLPLARAEVAALAAERLGGPVHAVALDWVCDLTNGNPLYVTELLADGRRTGRLAQVDGRWELTGQQGEMRRLGDLVGARLRSISDAARAALEVVALGAPLRLPHLEAVCLPESVEELEQAGLITALVDDRGGVVSLSHPVYGELVASTLSTDRRREVFRTLSTTIGGDAGDTAPLRVATWRVDAGEPDPGNYLDAARQALRSGGLDLADRLSEAADPGFARALVRGQIAVARTDFAEVEAIVAPFEAEAARGPRDVAAAYVEARYRALLRSDHPIEMARGFLDRASTWHDDPAWDATIAAQRAWTALHDGRPAAAWDHLEPHLARDELDPILQMYLLMGAMYTLQRLWRSAECEEVYARFQRHHDALEDAPWEAGARRIIIEAVRIGAGRDYPQVAARLEAARLAAEAAGDRPLAALAVYLVAELRLNRGHAVTATQLYREAVERVVIGDPMNLEAEIHQSLAEAAAQAGDVTTAEAALARSIELLGPQPNMSRRVLPGLERTRASIEAAKGDLAAARQRLLALADAVDEDVVAMCEALHSAMRLGADPQECVERLEAVAEGTDDPYPRLWAGRARALCGGDGVALLQVAEQAEELELDLLAAESAHEAAALCRTAGRRDAARRAGALASRCAARCIGTFSPILASVQPVRLTKRELEVATMAASGSTNAEIADALVLSVRSVESFVLRASRKLGVQSRKAIADALHRANG